MNSTLYICNICETKPDQLSHHKLHLKTQKHNDKKEIFKQVKKIENFQAQYFFFAGSRVKKMNLQKEIYAGEVNIFRSGRVVGNRMVEVKIF